MKEHPIPQDITGYKFHIVGNMTLKQFLEIGAGVVVAVLIYKTNLLNFVKFPLMALAAGIGAALAFVPFEERPLDTWFVIFLQTLYKPTKFYWTREPKVPEAFSYQASNQQKKQTDELDLTPARKQRIREYMASIRQQTELDSYEKGLRVQSRQILNIYHDQSLMASVVSVRKKSLPDLKTKVRSLNAQVFQIQGQKIKKASNNDQGQIVGAENLLPQQSNATQPSTSGARIISAQVTDPKRQLIKTQVTDASQIAKEVQIPELEAIKITNQTVGVQNLEPQTTNQNNQAAYSQTQTVGQSTTAQQQAQQNQNLPFPVKPDKPNVLVGMTLTPNGELIDNALVEIKNQTGQVLRAVKSNALGQFFVSSALKDGPYILEISKDNFNFEPVQIVLNNQVIEPLDIRSTN